MKLESTSWYLLGKNLQNEFFDLQPRASVTVKDYWKPSYQII